MITLSLVSHTNAGKTTLARTLLGRDIGEVRDAPHVTESAESHELLRTEAGDVLMLWDTPGFGDSVRLHRRLQQSAQPLGWLLSTVWDRWRDRAFWASQQALRHVREHSSVVLYLVNASESPQAAAYVAPEMALLGWVGKPVIVLLNQLGPPTTAEAEAAELRRWREHLAPHALVRAVLPLDAFARCWVQELTLWRAVQQALDGDPRMARLAEAWAAQRLATFEQAMQVLAESLVRTALHSERIEGGAGLTSTLRWAAQALGLPARDDDPRDAAQARLAQALQAEVQASTSALLALHGLQGQAQEGVILERVAQQFELRERLGEGRAALIGGAVSGALTGLAADVASGGLSLGGGLIAGGLLGALGGAGLARGVNLVRGTDHSAVAWQARALNAMAEAAVLRYLAVAHYGRGRGQWVQGEAPAHWPALVRAALAEREGELEALWRGRADGSLATTSLQALLAGATRSVLQQLYPGAWPATRILPAEVPSQGPG